MEAPSAAEPLRVMLFTDTLGDVNGVSRFIRNAADEALATGRDLIVATSTRFELPSRRNIINVPPRAATKMPRYENLELVFPPARRLLALARRVRPHVIHVSTPGPVGAIGRLVARRLKAPLLGVYHTDFPAYVERLFDDDGLAWLCRRTMRGFYKPFRTVFTRSVDYRSSLLSLGVPPSRIEALRPGIRTDEFNPSYRDESVWSRVPEADTSPDVCRVLSVGRVSVEKNLPMLTRVWPAASAELQRRGFKAQLIVIGDGPYRAQMERELAGTPTVFAGFRHGRELSAMYATGGMFVFPSLTDTLGQVVMEAQSSGLPVLVSDQGGPKEVVRDGRTGFVICADRPGDWVDRIVRLVADDELRRSLGAAAHESMRGMTLASSFDHFWSIHERARNESAAAAGAAALVA